MYRNSHEDNVRVHFEMLYFYICSLFLFFSLNLNVSFVPEVYGAVLQKEQKNLRINTTGLAHFKKKKKTCYSVTNGLHKQTVVLFYCVSQDSAIVCVIDGRRGPHLTSNFLGLPYPVSSFRGRRGEPRGYYPRRQPGQRGPPQVHRKFC